MKPCGLPKRKKLGPCGPHDQFECFCDNRHKSKERADEKRELKIQAQSYNSSIPEN